MSEHSVRSIVLRALKRYDAMAVENRVKPGTPDVECTLGWIELKFLRSWPKVPNDSAVLLPKFTPQQRVWLLKRSQAGGPCWVLLKVDCDWLLFTGDWAARHLGRSTKELMLAVAVWRCRNKFDGEAFAGCLDGST